MQTSFNVILPMQDGSVFKHSYLSNPPDLIELILVHIIALQQPVVLIDHYVQSVVVSIRNIQIPAFSHLTQVELSKMMQETGFKRVEVFDIIDGLASIHIARK